MQKPTTLEKELKDVITVEIKGLFTISDLYNMYT